ncbi:carboxymuconolactone decarboxylase family protein [Streptomyces sp. 4N509B]|uniref:carboxymuconolactone decarboxylase family protein n=1 Tax=Streptomyces sp. 4N509B TaxID=3457413 RepID=UPI003FCF193E
MTYPVTDPQTDPQTDPTTGPTTGPTSDPAPSGTATSAGERLFRQLAPTGATPPWEGMADVAPALGAEIEHGLGAVMARPGLDLRTRELAVVCMLAALGGCEPQLAFHVGGALRAGARPAEVVEAVTQVYLYAGFPRTINALNVVRKVFAEHGVLDVTASGS